MRKGVARFNTEENENSIPKALIFYDQKFVQQWYPPEVFLPITDREIPVVRPYYLISNFGRIWHIYENRFLSTNLDSKGYWMKPFALQNGKQKICRIHRLVMMTFCYIPGCESLEVNHKDGNKQNCILWNLEWCTPKENVEHAVKNGLCKNDRLSESQVHTICKLLEEGELSIPEISKKIRYII